MTDADPDGYWRDLLENGHRPLRMTRFVMRRVPSPPRCKVCNNPFEGLGGRVVAVAGFRRSRKNPELCTRCCDSMPPGGAEVDIAVLFADVRGSTGLGENAAPTEYAALLNRFYSAATECLVRHDAIIDKLIGDEVMALFIPGIAGPDYRLRAIEAATGLMEAVGYGTSEGPWLSLGAAVNAGVAFVGNVGEGIVDFTALGDPVNLAARLQTEAAGGEVVVADDVHEEVARRFPGAPVKTVSVRGREAPVTVRVIST